MRVDQLPAEWRQRVHEAKSRANSFGLDTVKIGADMLALANELEAALAQQAGAGQEEYVCTCPSGDGSLRWPCPRHPLMRVQDRNVEAVREKILERSRTGIAQYGATTERTDMSRDDWLREAQEELMDAAVYIEAAIASSAPGGGGEVE